MATVEPATGSNRDARLDALYQRLDAHDMAPYWAVRTDTENDEDAQILKAGKARPYVWKYKDIEPILYEAAELITMDDSERRSVVLVNPGLAPVRATVTTLYTAYRLNDPREIMPPHRHSINAVRIGLTGASNFTGVEGEDIVFGPGDLVLTPADAWHNHGNHGDDFAVNVSVLDLPLTEVLNAAGFEHRYEEDGVAKAEQTARFADDHSSRVYGTGGLLPRFVDHGRGAGRASPMYVYRWDATRELLERFRDHEGSPYDAISVEYIDPTTGRPPYPTMTFFGQLLRPGERTRAQRQNASLVCFPFEGSGHSIVDGERLDWRQFDAVAVPGNSWFEHVNGSDSEDAILFVVSDEPTLSTLGFLRRFGRTESGEVVRLV
ncbi:MAG: cupin domain-containing protein [Defluviicoccus sp.]|nr:cupin domain-containing protein [Defluviicoccus sp.]MDE0384778.1 cupin domain-containing protein [Defluviicoccus sp.]